MSEHSLEPHHGCAVEGCEIAKALMESLDERNDLSEQRDALADALEAARVHVEHRTQAHLHLGGGRELPNANAVQVLAQINAALAKAGRR